MTKFQLQVEYDYDFDLVGISCHMKDYRLCWALNQKLGIGLTKQAEDLDIKSKKQGAGNHSLYSYFDEMDHIEYQLLMNRNGASLVLPEQKNADFLLLLRNNYVIDLSELIEKIKEIEMVQTAFKIEAGALKSKENLIF
jgi:hypothetical protein